MNTKVQERAWPSSPDASCRKASPISNRSTGPRRENVAIFDTNWHAIFSFSGRDRVRYLHAITSNNIKELAEGYGVPALLLNPQGHILAELEIYALKEQILCLSHLSVRERTFATMKKYILGSQVQLEDVTGQLGSIAVEGPHAASIIAEATGLALHRHFRSLLRPRWRLTQFPAICSALPFRRCRGGNHRASRTPRAPVEESRRQRSCTARIAHRNEGFECAAA